MDETKQQKEALEYFRKSADDWRSKADVRGNDEVNVIKQRNDFVLSVIEKRGETALVLDVGCGTGDLVCDVAAKGTNAIGIDFAKEMIDLAKEKAESLGLEKAVFETASVFDYPFEENTYDVISANGFIEYISYEQFEKFLDVSMKALRPGGSLVFGSRNRLFNIFALNAFTSQEMEEGAIEGLLQEAILLANAVSIDSLIGFKAVGLQKEDKTHEKTGINVSTRYQFTPAQLVNKLKDKAFTPIEIYPIHVHGVPLRFKDKNPSVYGSIANLLQSYGYDNFSLIPQSSSFMIHGKKS